MKKTRMVLIVLAALAILAAGVGLMMYYKPHKDFATSTPDVRITAEAFTKAFDADEVNATWAYVKGDKTILVTGTVAEVGSDKDGNVDVVLAGGKETGTVSCAMMPDERERAKKLMPGERVRIKGQCTGRVELIDKQVIMIRCALAEEE
ncbi:MAG: hypothetical protein IPP94_02915 [Ignavibacteria bacterium]|nr:hypothetical protein [Ignavibacteria bacterium]